MRKTYQKILRSLFAQAIRFEVSAIETRMMQIESENQRLKAENADLREWVIACNSVQNRSIEKVNAQAKLAFGRIGHKW